MKTVLIIEDNKDIRENIAEILELGGYRALVAGNGKDGVSLAIEQLPDIIICDIMMPVLDGYGVIHMLQKKDTTKGIPFIFLSAKAERSEIRKGMEMGADDYITKPFESTELLSAIESRLKKNDILKEQITPDIKGLNWLISVAGGKNLLEQLANERSTHSYNRKQLVYAEGANAYRLFYIQKGKVKTFRTNEDGKELVMELYNEGDFFGYIALLEGTTYKESAEAMADTELALIPKDEFEQLVSSNREVMQKFIKLLAKNVADRERQLMSIAYNSLRKKVADTLLSIYSKYKGADEGYKIDMSRENLASVAGTAKESLIRTLSDFKDEQLIDIKGGDIHILNEKKLRNMVN